MKFAASSAVLVTVLSLLSAPAADASNRHAGTRRQLDLGGPHGTVKQVLQKRMPLAMAPEVGPKLRMIRKRSPQHIPEAAAAFGAVPMMNDGTGPIVGLVQKRQERVIAHNGQQGTAISDVAVSSDNTSPSSSGNNSTSSSTTSSSDDGDDDEDCDAEDDDGDDDDDDEDCDDSESDDSTDSSSSGSSTGTATSSSASSSSTASLSNGVGLDVNVNLKSPGSSSTSSSATAQSTGGSSSSAPSSASTGVATWFTQNGNAGACGKVNPDSAHVIALYTSVYANGANCGRTVMIENLDDGTSTTATVADECPSCGGPQDIDLSVGTFSAIDKNYQNDGVRNIKWWFTD